MLEGDPIPYSVVCRLPMQMLVLTLEDFVQIFASIIDKDEVRDLPVGRQVLLLTISLSYLVVFSKM
jgi:hypothetical protein